MGRVAEEDAVNVVMAAMLNKKDLISVCSCFCLFVLSRLMENTPVATTSTEVQLQAVLTVNKNVSYDITISCLSL